MTRRPEQVEQAPAVTADRLARDESAAERMDRRRAAREEADPARASGLRFSEDASAAAGGPNERDAIRDLAAQLARLLGRPLSIQYGLSMAVVRQRCAACREDIRASVSAPEVPDVRGFDVAYVAAIGVAARKAYMQHRCAPVESALLGFTYAELEALHIELERDGTAVLERAAAIERLLTTQSRSAT